VHCVERALRVGALNHILPPRDLRPYLIRAVERGMAKEKQAPAEPLEVLQYATASATAELTTGGDGNGRAEVPHWLRAPSQPLNPASFRNRLDGTE